MQPMYSRNPHGNFPEIVKLMNTAKTNLRMPFLRMATQGIQFKIHPAAETSRNRGFLYVKRQDGEYLGKIAPNGDFYGDPRFTEALRIFNSDPVACATLYGKQTGACCFCGITLTDGRSVAVGYGPICAANYGLPWGEVKTEPVVDLVDLAGMIGDLSPAEHTAAEHNGNAIAAAVEEEEYAFPALYHLGKECEALAQQPSMRAAEMASVIMDTVMREHDAARCEAHIIHLLTTYPILKE